MNLFKTLYKVSSLTMISRILGLIREIIISSVFGASAQTDAFNVAFKLPNLLRRIFAEGAFAQSFVPILSEQKELNSKESTALFIQNITGILSIILIFITIIGVIAAPIIIMITSPGFNNDPGKFNTATSLLRITFPYILFISLSSLLSGILNTFNKFSIPAFTPTFLNISFIIFAIFLSKYFDPPIFSLAWAVFIGGIIQLLFQIPAIYKLGLLKIPKFNLKDKQVQRVFKNMLPAILGVSVAQISIVISTAFQSFLPSKSISWISYADRLMELPNGVLGVAISIILLPSLSKAIAINDRNKFSQLLDWGLKISIILALPAGFALCVLSYPIIATLFQNGRFTIHDAIMTQGPLIAYSFGIIALIMVKILASSFYAQKDIKTPVKIAIVTLIITTILNFILIGPLKHIGLALSITIGAYINSSLLLGTAIYKKIYISQSKWLFFILKIVIACIIMSLILWISLNQQFYLFNWNTSFIVKTLQLAFLVIIGVVVYFSTLAIFGFKLKEFKNLEGM